MRGCRGRFWLVTLLAAGVVRADWQPAPRPAAEPPGVPARAWVLVDARSGWLLAEARGAQRLPPASLAKLMTAYLVFRHLAAARSATTEVIRVPPEALGVSGARLYLHAGEAVTLEALLQGMLVASANDAARALAIHLAGSLEAFTAQMNRTARALGLEDTRYAGPAGLARGAYTTARDTARLCLALLERFPAQRRRFAQRRMHFRGLTFYNPNDLLWAQAGVDGFKTGRLGPAGWHLAAGATRGDQARLVVVLGAPDGRARREAALALLDYAFDHYQTRRLFGPAEPVLRVPVAGGTRAAVPAVPARPVYVTLPRGGFRMLAVRYQARRRVSAPLAAGAALGRLTLLYRDEPLATTPLVAGRSVPRGNFLHEWLHWLQRRWGEGDATTTVPITP